MGGCTFRSTPRSRRCWPSRSTQIPDGPYSFEPKWDGFRSIVFADGGEVEIGSRNERPMTRYFPELVAAVTEQFPRRCVIDGEIVVPGPRRPPARLRGAAAADPPGGQPGERCSPARHRPTSSPSTCSPWATPTTPSGRSSSAGRRWRRPSPAWPRPLHLTPATTDRALAAAVARTSSRGPGWTGSSPSRWRAPTSRTSGSCSRSSTSGPPTAWWPATGRTSPARRRSARSCSACTATPGTWPASASSARSRWPAAASCSPSSSRWSPRSTGIRGTGRARRRGRGPRARPSTAGGTPPRTCRSPRCGRNGWWRSAMTTWRARGSGTPPSSCAGGRTATPVPAPMSSWRSR